MFHKYLLLYTWLLSNSSQVQKGGNKNAKGIFLNFDRNADHCNKQLETTKRSQSKLDSSIAETKTELKAMNSRLNNAEKQISYLEDKIMEITQSEQQTKKQEVMRHTEGIKKAIDKNANHWNKE